MLGGFKSRLAAQETVANPTKHEEIPEVTSQRLAEESFVKDLINLGGVQPSQIRRRLRVDDTFGQGKRELQIVVTTDYTVYCILIRPWSGKYKPAADASNWLRITETEDETDIKQVKSPLLEIEQQCKLLHGHLVKTGAPVKTSAVEGYVIFTNEEIEIPDDIAKSGTVLIGPKAKAFCRGLMRTWTQYVTAPLIPSLFTGALSYKQLSAASTGLNKSGSYDKITLTGGRLIEGDFMSCALTAFDRKEIGRIDFIHNRSSWLGSAQAIFGSQPTVTLRLYKRGQTPGWISNGVFATNEIPFNVNVEFLVTGETAVAKIPANEVEFITLA